MHQMGKSIPIVEDEKGPLVVLNGVCQKKSYMHCDFTNVGAEILQED